MSDRSDVLQKLVVLVLLSLALEGVSPRRPVCRHGAGEVVDGVRVAEWRALGPAAPVDVDISSARALAGRVVERSTVWLVGNVVSLMSQNGRGESFVILDTLEGLQWELVWTFARRLKLYATECARAGRVGDGAFLGLQTLNLDLEHLGLRAVHALTPSQRLLLGCDLALQCPLHFCDALV